MSTKGYDRTVQVCSTRTAGCGLKPEESSPRTGEWKPAVRQLDQRHHNHLNYYKTLISIVQGPDYEYKVADNDETFDKGEGQSWEAEAARFDSIMSEWREQLEKADPSKFDEMAPPRNDSKWQAVIANINAHNAHHGGQIVLLRKLQGSWDPNPVVT